jgi:uncharacterized protein
MSIQSRAPAPHIMCSVAGHGRLGSLNGKAPAPPKHTGQFGGEAMDQSERRIIDDLFDRLQQAEDQAGPRDPDAEALIRRHAAAQPAAPYYMAQAIVVQQEALARAQARIQELERQGAERPSGGFLSGLFGGGEKTETPAPARGAKSRGGFGRHRQAGAGGGFLAGAMQTALGVAGGFLVADAISGLFAADEAAAGAPEAAPEPGPGLAEEGPFGGEDPDLSGEADGDLDFDAF